MEVLSFCYSMPCCQVESLNLKLVERSLDLSRSKLFVARKTRVVCAGKNNKRNSIEFPDLEFLHRSTIQSPDQRKWSRLFSLLKGSQNVASSNVLNVSYDGYVIDGKEGVRRVSESEDSVTKVLIPGLPDEPGGDFSSKISSCFWEWKPKLTVHYEKSGSENINSPAVLFLPGFGVGSFHYEKQLKDLGRDYRVWALDFLGQGMSLVSEDPAPIANENGGSEENDMMWGFGEESKPWANELVYSVDLWRDQVSHFIEQVIGEPVYVVGNSLGGFVALYFAAYNPQLVKGITLLNATPFWGFLPNPIRSPWLAGIFPWAGTFPLPANVRKLTEFVWQKISDPRSIGEILEQVYADHSTRVDKVFSRILEITQHPAAAASFASIMFAPRGQLSFKESLSKCQINNVPICLMYGKEDPWVNPFWGFQVKRQLPDAPYYEISPAGHCPHDEVPEVVNYLLRGWMKNIESQGSSSLPLLDDPDFIDYGVSKNLEFIREGSKKSVRVHFFGSRFSIWNQISSFFKSRITDLGIKSPQHR